MSIYPPDQGSYAMVNKPRGVAIIINNHHFHDPKFPHRTGTDKDAKDLSELFESLEFTVKSYPDLTVQQMRDVLISAAKMDHTKHDCIIVSVLTHGGECKLYGVDRKHDSKDPNNALLIEDFTTYLDGKHCPSLIGKPKVFILQTCKGLKKDEGEIAADGGEAGTNVL